MSECRQITERLASYVDDLLPAAERADVDRHLARCASCRRAVSEEEGARAILRARAAELRSAALPTGLRSRCEAAAQDQLAALAPPGRRRLLPLFVTAALALIGVLALFSLATQRSDTLFAARLTADHIKCVQETAGPETASADARRLEALLSEQYGWKAHVPPSSPQAGVELIGTRRCLFGTALLPHLMYRAGGRDMSLYMMEGQVRDEADVETLGYRSRVWSRGATTFVLVSPADAGDLTTAVEYLRQEAF